MRAVLSTVKYILKSVYAQMVLLSLVCLHDILKQK